MLCACAVQAVCRFSSPGLRWTLNGGLGEGEVRRLEGEMGLALPPYLRASFMTHDGQTYHAHPVRTQRRGGRARPQRALERLDEKGLEEG